MEISIFEMDKIIKDMDILVGSRVFSLLIFIVFP